MREEVEKNLPSFYKNLPVVTVKLPGKDKSVLPYLLGLKQDFVVDNSEETVGAISSARDKERQGTEYENTILVRYQVNDDDENPVFSDNASVVEILKAPVREDKSGNLILSVRTAGYGKIKSVSEATQKVNGVECSIHVSNVAVTSRNLKSLASMVDGSEIKEYMDLLDKLKSSVNEMLSIYNGMLAEKSPILPDNIDEIMDVLEKVQENLEGRNPDPIYHSNLLISIFRPRGQVAVDDLVEQYIERSHSIIPHLKDAVALVEKYCLEVIKFAVDTNTKIDLKIEAEIAELQKEHTLRMRQLILKKQLEAVNRELGEGEDDELLEFEEILADEETLAILPEEVIEEARKTLQNVRGVSAAHSSSDRRRLRILLKEFPFGYFETEKPSLSEAREVLDSGHYGLDKAKRRIVEQLAIDIKRGDGYPGKPILLVGPKGIGKTTLLESIAEATGRPLAYVACGGLNDPQTLRGFEPTYVGAREGRIIDALLRAKSEAALLSFDEIDKLGSGMRGNPEDVLMAVTDPAQNQNFKDDFLRVGVDLSYCKIIATANDLSKVNPILVDRFEVIHLGAYKIEEKMEIAKRFTVPRMMESSGLTEEEFSITPEAVKVIIEKYTNEPGVRQLESAIRRLTEITTTKMLDGEIESIVITPEVLSQKDWLGEPHDRREKVSPEPTVGEVNGLYWSQNGGGLLKVQVVSYKGAGKLQATGNLMKVMKESSQYVMSGIKANLEDKLSASLSDEEKKTLLKKLHKSDFVIHVPDAATPKDGPSAGVTITTAITSDVLNLPVDNLVSMTGEVDIKGNVRGIGGLPEKLKGALEAGCTTAIVPKANEKDLKEVPLYVRQQLTIYVAAHIDEVLQVAIPNIKSKLDIKCNMPPLYVIPEDEIANDNKKPAKATKPAPTKKSAGQKVLCSTFEKNVGGRDSTTQNVAGTTAPKARKSKLAFIKK